ncbi:CBS domain-containing protein [Desulfoferrobacter suflitae]|uniref:CBS domain-containing protein n=1 Tax=Desulfoferrobacter suflitae TaxID=2865782 RepID=UPI00216402EA|nr:CBS domain-containing protein [Desulfoferrobacter suflitae]MCK8601829.1 CBS domain-containing protein [Desulfoferrobacter suflitae]
MEVQEFMTSKVEYIDGDASVYDAIERMVDKRIRSLVVKPSKREKMPGVVTARDVVFRVLAKHLDPGSVRVAEIASRPLYCMAKGTSVLDAASIMEEKGVARVFVCEGEQILGVFSLIDAMQSSLILRARK